MPAVVIYETYNLAIYKLVKHTVANLCSECSTIVVQPHAGTMESGRLLC